MSFSAQCGADRRLEAITLREQSLNLFHALGKVFYNKRMWRRSNSANVQVLGILPTIKRIRRQLQLSKSCRKSGHYPAI